jgi:hypothetical protein
LLIGEPFDRQPLRQLGTEWLVPCLLAARRSSPWIGTGLKETGNK